QSKDHRRPLFCGLRILARLLSQDQSQWSYPTRRDLPTLQQSVRSGGGNLGGTLGYPSQALYEEVAFLAYYLHWPYEEIMSLDHRERQRWVGEVSRINQRLNDSARGEEE